MLELTDEFKQITTHMAILLNEINQLEQKLKDGVDGTILPSVALSLREKRETYDSLQAELRIMGKLEQKATPVGHIDIGVDQPIQDGSSNRDSNSKLSTGLGDGEYYLDADRETF